VGLSGVADEAYGDGSFSRMMAQGGEMIAAVGTPRNYRWRPEAKVEHNDHTALAAVVRIDWNLLIMTAL
jgi:hypothetical protein